LKVLITNRQKNTKLNLSKIKKEVQKILENLDFHNSEISILFTSDKHIKELNVAYRKKNKPTDVLSFSQIEGDFPNLNTTILGDVVISVDTAIRQAADFGHSVEKEIFTLLIHGILHLLRFDHEQSEEDAKIMRSKENELLALIY
jgi:probable rRNA maturation factor